MIFLGMRSEFGVGVAASKGFLQGLKPAENEPFAWELKLPPPKEAELRPGAGCLAPTSRYALQRL
ncbi:MAG: hypothetical protein DMG35_07620 [Acidobacteria bacterium]|nr:MAG: hypothetical protein DMG35_07620 [Acidobacteriota bacterium]